MGTRSGFAICSAAVQASLKRLKRLLKELGDLQRMYLEYFHRRRWEEATLDQMTAAMAAKRAEIDQLRRGLETNPALRGTRTDPPTAE